MNDAPLKRWRVYPGESRRFVEVLAWGSRAAMLRYMRAIGIRGHAHAVGVTISNPSRTRMPRWVASVHLVLKASNAETITHEAVHAAMAYVALVADLRGLSSRGEVEERLADAAGRIAQGIADGLRKLTVIKTKREP